MPPQGPGQWLVGSKSSLRAAFSSAGGDAAPTDDATQAFNMAQTDLAAVMTKWSALTTKDLPEVNSHLTRAGLAPIVIGAQGPAPNEEAPGDDDMN